MVLVSVGLFLAMPLILILVFLSAIHGFYELCRDQVETPDQKRDREKREWRMR